MGNECSIPERKPYKFTLQDLQDLNIGDKKEMPNGCGPAIEGTQAGSGYAWLIDKGMGWPDNQEFEWGGLGSGCSLCSAVDAYGCECLNAASVGGNRGTVKRKAFTGDKTECCLANFYGKDSAKVVNGKTCAYNYRDPTSAECTNVFKDYCTSVGPSISPNQASPEQVQQAKNVVNNLFNMQSTAISNMFSTLQSLTKKETFENTQPRLITDEKCKSLSKSNSTLYNNLMKDYCNKDETNAKSDTCIDWCKNNSTECTTLNLQTDCKKYDISDCSRQKVIDIQTKCKRYGIESEQGLRLYGCTPSGITKFEEECRLAEVDLSLCSPTKLQDAIQNKLAQAQLKAVEEQKQLSQQNYQETKNTILGLLESETPEETPEEETSEKKTSTTSNNNTILYIIIILLILCSLSVSSGFLFLRK